MLWWRCADQRRCRYGLHHVHGLCCRLRLIQKKFNFSGWKESVISIVFIVLSFVIGANLPIILGKAAWSYITFVYIFFAAVLPMWLLKQPRDHMTTFMFVAMIAGAVVGCWSLTPP